MIKYRLFISQINHPHKRNEDLYPKNIKKIDRSISMLPKSKEYTHQSNGRTTNYALLLDGIKRRVTFHYKRMITGGIKEWQGS
tara:strand:- start:432 stop:680 length:249 start_codon:yes stop_codon:yes gene_type:complete